VLSLRGYCHHVARTVKAVVVIAVSRRGVKYGLAQVGRRVGCKASFVVKFRVNVVTEGWYVWEEAEPISRALSMRV